MPHSTRRSMPTAALVLLLCVVGLSSVAAGDDGDDRGFFFGFGVGRHDIDLEFDERTAVAGAGISYDTAASGAELVLGYGFGPHLRLETSAFAADHDAGPEGADVKFGDLRVSAQAPLLARGAWRPHLIAGFGVTGMPISGPGFPERTYLMTQGHFGAGLRVLLGGRLYLQGDYLRTFHDVEREFRDTGGDGELRFVGGDGRSHSLRALAGWQF